MSEIVKQCSIRGTFFHRAGWRRVIARAYGHGTPSLLVRRGGEIRGVLPLVHLRSRLFGAVVLQTGVSLLPW